MLSVTHRSLLIRICEKKVSACRRKCFLPPERCPDTKRLDLPTVIGKLHGCVVDVHAAVPQLTHPGIVAAAPPHTRRELEFTRYPTTQS
jgi:hypothetical protein